MNKAYAQASEVNNIYVCYKYTDKNGAKAEGKVQILKNKSVESSVVANVTIDTSAEDKKVYKFNSTIDASVDESLHDTVIKKIMTDNNMARMEFDVTFYIEDEAGNNTTSNRITVVYDTRNTFNSTISVPLKTDTVKGYTLIDDITVSYKAYDKTTIGDDSSTKDIYIEVADDSKHYVDEGGVFSIVINGKTINAPSGDEYKITLPDLDAGFYDIMPKITGENTTTHDTIDLVSQNIEFYITNNKNDNTDNKAKLSNDLVLSNKVYQLNDQSYYYLDAGGSNVISYPYGALYDEVNNKATGGSTYPSFSNINEAKKYLKYMELQDLYLIKISASIASYLNSGQGTTYVKATGETVTAQEGQLWIRYKKNTWQNTATAYSWAFYYYGNGNLEDGININALPTNLTNAINEVVNRISNEGSIVYLVEEETLNQKTGAPYLASTQIHAEYEEATASKNGTVFATPAKYDGDKAIYQNTIKVDDKDY
jgi:hypothetical protein